MAVIFTENEARVWFRPVAKEQVAARRASAKKCEVQKSVQFCLDAKVTFYTDRPHVCTPPSPSSFQFTKQKKCLT